jgi:hypothetical protein
MVSAIERIRDITRQPGMKRTCARLPGRLVNRNIRYRSTPAAAWSGRSSLLPSREYGSLLPDFARPRLIM